MIYLKKIIPLPKDKESSLAEKPLKVLIVEDDPSMREILVEYCNNKKYITVAVESGEEALQKYKTEAPNFIILDLMLPGISGKEVLSKIRELSSNIPVIITSGFGEKEDLIDLMELRADSYLAKPFKYEKFNYLTNQAEKYIDAQWQIQAYQYDLEQRIEDATRELQTVIKLLDLEKTAAQRLEARSMLFLKNADEGMILFDEDRIDDVTPAILKMLDISLDELQKNGITYYAAENYKRYFAEEIKKMTESSFDVELVKEDGSRFYAETSISFVKDNEYDKPRRLIKFWDVSKRLEHFLTGLPGKRIFLDHLCTALHQGRAHVSRKGEKSIFAVFYVDLNDFKKLNDTLGHAAGDKHLIKIANLLKGSIRKTDTVAHPHGDEFYLLFPEMKDAEDVFQLITTLKNFLNENDIDASIGGYIYDFSWERENDKELTKEIIKNAEDQMYLAKKHNTTGTRVFIANSLIEG